MGIRVLVFLAYAAVLGIAASSWARPASDEVAPEGVWLGAEEGTGCSAMLPPGHPPVESFLGLPPGHPPIPAAPRLPAGHPPVPAAPRLPAGHPPVPSGPPSFAPPPLEMVTI